jgi:hypothetical protein
MEFHARPFAPVSLVLADGRRVPIAATTVGYVHGVLTYDPGLTDITPDEVIGVVIGGRYFDKVGGRDERN